MGDPLSVLRHFIIYRKIIIVTKTRVLFGELSWPKTTKTNYLKWGTGIHRGPKEYYTLECLIFLLKYVTLPHSLYVRQAIVKNKPFVHRPDRKVLLAYLYGEIDIPASIVLQDPQPILRGI